MSSKKWKNRDALYTIYDDDKMFNLIKEIIIESKFKKRNNNTGMCAPIEADDAHIVTRGDHEAESSYQAGEIAEGLGLNESVSKEGMLGHDAGQYGFAHEGEERNNDIARILHIGYYHHNAEGVKVWLNEKIIPKIINKVPEAKTNEELRNKLKNDIWYVIEMVVGHDGEATSNDNKKFAKENEKYDTLKEKVLSNVSNAIRTNNYKCAVTTLEAQIAKPADILAYMRSDVMTGLSKGVISRLSDDYLEVIGKLLDETEEETADVEEDIKNATPENRKQLIDIIRKYRIDRARKILREIKINKLKETEEDIYTDDNKEIFAELDEYIKELDELGIEITDIKPEERATSQRIKEKILTDFKQKQIEQGQDKNIVISQVDKLKRYIKNVEKDRKRVMESLLTKVQDTLREDYIQSTLKRWDAIEANKELTDEERYQAKKESMDFSNKANKIIFGKNGIKDLNYREIVQYSKKVYQTSCLPKAVFKLVKESSQDIIKSGVIINKFYDPEVLKRIENNEIKQKMHQRDINYEDNEKNRSRISKIKNKANTVEKLRKLKGRRFTGKKTKQKIEKMNLYSDITRFIEEQNEGFARTCEDIYYSIPYTVREIVEKAVRPKYEEAQCLPDEERAEVYKIKKELAKRFGKKENTTKDELESYINEKIEEERSKIEQKVAYRFCLDYISGFPDESIKKMVVKTGMISQRKLDSENVPDLKGAKNVQKLSQALRDEDEGR